MKTLTLHTAIIAVFMVFFAPIVMAQPTVCTVISVKGTSYSDKMWLITNSVSTPLYDNGYDAYKLFGSSLTPQLYGIGVDGSNYQIVSINDANASMIGFKPGLDSVYTLSFTNYDLQLVYSEFYLYDEITQTRINVLNAESYTFKSKATDDPHRFTVQSTFITSWTPTDTTTTDPGTDPVIETPEQPTTPEPTTTDTVVTTPDTPVTPEVPVTDTVVTTPPTTDDSTVDNSTGNNGKHNGHNKDKKDKKDKIKIKMYCANNIVTIDNQTKYKGIIKVVNTKSGREVKNFIFNQNGITKLQTNLPKGVYVIYGRTQSEEFSQNVIIQ